MLWYIGYLFALHVAIVVQLLASLMVKKKPHQKRSLSSEAGKS